MIVGIVGAGQEKFTSETEQKAREIIRAILNSNYTATITSGHSPVGGIDIFVEEEFYKNPTTGGLWIRDPIIKGWGTEGQYGYKARNIDIAKADTLISIVVKNYPPNYKFETWELKIKDKGCFHCEKAGRPFDHCKSGACYTATKHKEMLNREPVYYIVV